jgi:hypothetical protein
MFTQSVNNDKAQIFVPSQKKVMQVEMNHLPFMKA